MKRKIEGGGWRGSDRGEFGRGGWVRVDVNEELKLLYKCKKKMLVGGLVSGGGLVGVGRGGAGLVGNRVGGGVGYGGCETRIEGIVKCI